MATIDRTAFNALVDDSGSGTDGTIWDKAAIADVLLDPVDDAIGAALACIDDTGDLSFAARSELTIAAGAVTVTLNVHSLDTQGNAASDDLDTLTAGASVRDHHFLVLQPENAARVVTVKHNTGNIKLKGGDFAMNDANHRLVLVKDGASWFELSRNATIGVTSDVWTPVIGGSGGTSGQSYSAQVGYSLKIDALVFLQGYVSLSNKGTITGDVEIQNLPFAAANLTSLYAVGTPITFSGLGTNWIVIAPRVSSNASAALLLGRQSAGTGVQTLTTADITNSTEFTFSLIYRVA